MNLISIAVQVSVDGFVGQLSLDQVPCFVVVTPNHMPITIRPLDQLPKLVEGQVHALSGASWKKLDDATATVVSHRQNLFSLLVQNHL